MFGGPEVSYHQTHSATDWLSILRTPYTTQNLQRKRRTLQSTREENNRETEETMERATVTL
jgi:hypothetical protein